MTTRLPPWVRRTERQLAPPGWVQVIATSLAPEKSDMDAAALVSSEFMHVFWDRNGNPAFSKEISIDSRKRASWEHTGVIVPAIDALERGLIPETVYAEVLRRWT